MENSPALWLVLLTIGVLVLGAAIFYAQRRNQTRTPAEKAVTAAATRREYKAEDESSGQ